MRIAIDGTSIDASASGARARFLQLLSAYAALPRRHDLAVFVPRGRGLAEVLAPRGLECVVVEPAPGPLARLAGSGRIWRERIRAARADAFQAETLPLPAQLPVPVIATVHDLRDREGVPGTSIARRLYARLLLPRSLRTARRVIAVSAATARRIAELGVPLDRIDVVPNAPDPGLMRPPEEALDVYRGRRAYDGRAVLALGHLEPRKNLGRLIEAVRRLRADAAFADLHLQLAGRDRVGEGARLRRLAAKSPAVPLEILGPLSDADRAAALAAAAVVATPSLVEGFGLVPLEAMRIGTPVVAARAGALPEVCGDAAILCDPFDTGDLACALGMVLADARLASDLVARGYLRAGAYSWPRSAAALLRAHDRLAGL